MHTHHFWPGENAGYHYFLLFPQCFQGFSGLQSVEEISQTTNLELHVCPNSKHRQMTNCVPVCLWKIKLTFWNDIGKKLGTGMFSSSHNVFCPIKGKFVIRVIFKSKHSQMTNVNEEFKFALGRTENMEGKDKMLLFPRKHGGKKTKCSCAKGLTALRKSFW